MSCPNLAETIFADPKIKLDIVREAVQDSTPVTSVDVSTHLRPGLWGWTFDGTPLYEKMKPHHELRFAWRMLPLVAASAVLQLTPAPDSTSWVHTNP